MIFTAVDDSSCGEALGSGSPNGYYANPALGFAAVSIVPEITCARFAYASNAVPLGGASAKDSKGGHNDQDVQAAAHERLRDSEPDE